MIDLRRLVPLALALLLAACGTSADDAPAARSAHTGLSEATLAALNPQPPLLPVPDGVRALQGTRIDLESGSSTLAPLALTPTNRVELALLVIGATPDDPSLGAWQAILDQAGAPYETLVATEEELTPERLVATDGTGRFQAVLLSTNALTYHDAETDSYPSAFGAAEWELLHRYEREFDVRQVAFYTNPEIGPEAYGVAPVGVGEAAPEGYVVTATPEGAEIFGDLAPGAEVPIRHAYIYRSELEVGSNAVSLLEDGDGNVLAVTSTSPDGRERLALLFDNAAYGGVPLPQTQLLGHDLLRWATKGVHLGERRLHLAADVDDWFVPTAMWDVESGDFSSEPFVLGSDDAASFERQQAELLERYAGTLSDFAWTMAFNGAGAEPDAPEACDPDPDLPDALSSATKCLADEFRWVNHTWDHKYMDRNPPAYDIGYEDIRAEIDRNDAIVDTFGMRATYAAGSLVTGDVSGLGWHAPGGPDTGPKVDHGLAASNPDLLAAAADTGRRFIASNMSTPSHEPDCAACGIVHPLDDRILLVPRWPTNVFAAVHTPGAALDAYLGVYGPGGPEPTFPATFTYEEYLDVETDIALAHVLSGSPYPHYFHVANLNEYAAGRSLLTDWADALLAKVEALVDLPLSSPGWDELGAYVEDRTSFAGAGASGVWDRASGEITVTAANGGTVYLTGASFGSPGTSVTYGGRTISRRAFGAGESVTLAVAADPPPTPEPTVLSVNVTGQGTVTVAGEGTASGPIEFNFYDVAVLTAVPDDGWGLERWSGDASGAQNPIELAMDADRSVTAHFIEVADLDVVLSGDGLGLVVADAGGFACAGDACSASLAKGTVLTLVPVPLYGASFVGWSGACSGDGACRVALDADVAVGARFEATP